MKALDLVGKRFNNLVVMERVANSPNGQTVWKCKCDCGNITIVRRGNLTSGAVKSCGCLIHNPSANRTHNMSKSRLYQERIDNNGDYCPENCKWIPKAEQSSNRRNCVIVTYNGKTQNLNDWCKELGLDYKRVNNRMKKLGWTFEKAISEPVNVNKRNMKIRKLKEGD